MSVHTQTGTLLYTYMYLLQVRHTVDIIPQGHEQLDTNNYYDKCQSVCVCHLNHHDNLMRIVDRFHLMDLLLILDICKGV